jgi:hypothetical protein
MPKTICKHCGKSFSYERTYQSRKYCSKPCAYEGMKIANQQYKKRKKETYKEACKGMREKFKEWL